MLRRLMLAAACLLTFGTALAAVDANTATREQLDAIRGIGPALSEKIIAERGKSPFKDMNDLQQRVRGIGPQTAKKLEAAGLTVGAARAPAGAGATGGSVAGGSTSSSIPSGNNSVGKGTAPAARITTLGSGVVTETDAGSSGAQARSDSGLRRRDEPRVSGQSHASGQARASGDPRVPAGTDGAERREPRPAGK